jgi:hypothetical protein
MCSFTLGARFERKQEGHFVYKTRQGEQKLTTHIPAASTFYFKIQ